MRARSPSPVRQNKVNTFDDLLIAFQRLGSYSRMLEFFKKNNVKQQIGDIEYNIIMLKDSQFEELANLIGITVDQLFRSKSFNNLMFNYFNQSSSKGNKHWIAINGLEFSIYKLDALYRIEHQRFYTVDEPLIMGPQIEAFKQEYPFLVVDPNVEVFSKLDVNAVSNILINLPPKQVLETCRLDKKFARFCENETLFTLLMKRHFPDYEIQNNSATLTYKSIVNGTYVGYIVSGNDQEGGVITRFFPTEKELRDDMMKYIASYTPSILAIDSDLLFTMFSGNIVKIMKKYLETDDWNLRQTVKENVIKELKNSDIYTLKIKDLVDFIEDIGQTIADRDNGGGISITRGYFIK